MVFQELSAIKVTKIDFLVVNIHADVLLLSSVLLATACRNFYIMCPCGNCKPSFSSMSWLTCLLCWLFNVHIHRVS